MDKIFPSVSVIIPTYNRSSLLSRSINSILEQTYKDFEIIVVDDASTDNTEDVVKALDDSRIRYIKHDANRGGSAARNTGINLACGKFIAFQDSDDEWFPEKLEKQIKILASAPTQVGVVYTGFWRIQGDKKEYIPNVEQQLKEGNIHPELLKGNFVTTQSVLVKKECFQKAGMFDESLPRLQDWELFLRISKHYEFRYIPEPLVKSFFTEGSISSNKKSLIHAIEIILNKHIDEYNHNKKIYENQLIVLSNFYRISSDLKKCRKYLIDAFKLNFRLGLVVAIFFSFFGITFYNSYINFIDKLMRAKI